MPRWRADGKEIFYLAPDNKLIGVVINGGSTAFQVGGERALFDTRAGGPRSVYDVSPDGEHFLVNTLAEQTGTGPITLVVNWPALLTN